VTLDRCIKDTAAELNLKESDVREIAEKLRTYKKRRVAEGRLDRLDEDMRKYAGAEAEKTRIAAALKRKQAAIAIVLRDEWAADVREMVTGGMDRREAILAKLVGSYEGIGKARDSVSRRRESLDGEWLYGMEREIKEQLPHVPALLRDPRAAKPLLDNVVREWRQLSKGGGVTGSADARKLAEILDKYAEASRIEANRAGAGIGKLFDWGGPQVHDAAKVRRTGRDAWIAGIVNRLDLERSFGAGVTYAEARDILSDTFDTIVTGRSLRTTAKQRGERLSPANLARGLEKERVLHFKSADDWIAYNDQFGRGNVLTGMIDHQRRMARVVANMQKLTANPQVFLEAFLESQRAEVRKAAGGSEDAGKAADDLQALKADLDKGSGSIGKAFAEIMGDTLSPGNINGARLAANVRATLSMAHLGSAVVSSLTDLPNLATRLRFHGQGLLEGYAVGLRNLLSGRAARESRQLAELIGVANDSMLGDIHNRYAAEDHMGGFIARASSAFFRLTGLTGWTDRLTNAFVHMASSHMAQQTAVAWAELPEAYRHVLGMHGINESRWQVLRQMVEQIGDYRYVLPELARGLPDAAFEPIIAGELVKTDKVSDARRARLIERARRELELDLRGYFLDEASFAVVRGDDRTRMFMTQATQPGTLLGEAIRFTGQYKGYPVAYFNKVLKPMVKGQGPGGARDYGAIAHLAASTLVLGYVSMSIKDFLKGRTPKDPLRYETVLAALVQGGGFGLLGDFLFSKRDRLGGGVAADMAGPLPGLAYNAIEMFQDLKSGDAKAGDAYHFLLNNTPGLNIWWLRAGLNFLILNQIEEWISPGSLRRRERRINKDFGQRYIVDPTPLT
jgi:hypothetical protein